MPKCTLVVLSNPVPSREDEYNDWYDHRHLKDVLRVPGFVSAERFRIAARPMGPASWQYCALYQLDHDDPQAALDDLAGRAGTDRMPMSDAMAEDWTAVLYEPIGGLSREDMG